MHLIFLIIGLTKQAVELLHRLCLDFVNHVDVRLHGLVVAVPRPFHDNLWRYAHRKGMADERPATRMGTYQFPLGLDLVNALLSPEVCLTDHLIDSGKPAKFMQAVIHLLVRDDRQCLVIFEGHVRIPFKDALALLVQLNAQGVVGFYGRDVNMILMDITSAKIEHIGIAESRATLEEEDVPYPLQVLPVFRSHIFP